MTVWSLSLAWCVFETYLALRRKPGKLPPVGIIRGTGGSMTPLIRSPGFVAYAPRPQYEVGDVVVFRSDGVYVVHRIIDRTADGFLTKGDGNRRDDGDDHGLVRAEDIIGGVWFAASYSGFGNPTVRV